MRAFAIVIAVIGVAGCIPDHGPMMDPGQDCVACHNSGEGPDFSAAGTLFLNPEDDTSQGLRGGRIHVTDANGRTLTLRSNDAGNFYTREKLAFPLQVIVEHDGQFAVMSSPVPEGGCNRCHLAPNPPALLQDPTTLELKSAPGRVALLGPQSGDEFMLPGYDCQACHRVGGSARNFPWTSSGTVFASQAGGAGDEGVTVTITDAQGRVFTAVTNRVGNFRMTDAIAFGRTARVQISKGGITRRMDEELPHGSCNACHQPGGEGEGRVSLTGGGD